jgi:hypothetical protein
MHLYGVSWLSLDPETVLQYPLTHCGAQSSPEVFIRCFGSDFCYLGKLEYIHIIGSECTGLIRPGANRSHKGVDHL